METAAKSASDCDATFEFFDDFTDRVTDYFTIANNYASYDLIQIATYKAPYTWIVCYAYDKNILWRFDHNEKKWEKIKEFPLSTAGDGHLIGNVFIDSQNNIHVFDDCHGGAASGG